MWNYIYGLDEGDTRIKYNLTNTKRSMRSRILYVFAYINLHPNIETVLAYTLYIS